MRGEIIPAPAPDLIRYLAILRRAFVCIRDWGTSRDREGMLFGGWLADALHNVPSLLLYFDLDKSGNRPLEIADWLERIFPQQMQGQFHNAPKRLLAVYQQILSPEGTASELGLAQPWSAHDLALAPTSQMRRYLSILWGACLAMRMVRNHVPDRPHWPNLPRFWSAGADEDGTANAYLASVLEAVPEAMVRWSQFDEAQFQRTIQETEALIPAKHRQYWKTYFEPTYLL